MYLSKKIRCNEIKYFFLLILIAFLGKIVFGDLTVTIQLDFKIRMSRSLHSFKLVY